jgi:hypothetical protein
VDDDDCSVELGYGIPGEAQLLDVETDALPLPLALNNPPIKF